MARQGARIMDGGAFVLDMGRLVASEARPRRTRPVEWPEADAVFSLLPWAYPHVLPRVVIVYTAVEC